MLKKLLAVIMLVSISVGIGWSASVDSADRLINKNPITDHSDKSKLDAENINAIGDNILSGKYHIIPMKVYSSEYTLLSSTGEKFECASASDTNRTYMYLNGKWNQTTPALPQVINFGIDDGDSSYLSALSIPFKSFEQRVHISSITFCVDTGTVTGIDVKQVSDQTPFVSGSSILGGTINVGINGKYGSTSILSTIISSGTVLRIESSGTTGNPTKLWGRIIYTLNNGN